MPYELKPSEELEAIGQKEKDDLEKYGDKDWSPEEGLPVYKDMAAVTTKELALSKNRSGVVFKIVMIAIAAAVVFGVIMGVKYMVGSGGEDISQYLGLSESEIASKLGITFEQQDEQAKRILQYSGGTVAVRAGNDVQIVYIDGKQVGVCTDNRDYRFFGIGINDPQPKVAVMLTYSYNKDFTVMSNVMGNSRTYFYVNEAENTCLVLAVNTNSARVVYMEYFTDYQLVSRDLSF